MVLTAMRVPRRESIIDVRVSLCLEGDLAAIDVAGCGDEHDRNGDESGETDESEGEVDDREDGPGLHLG